MSPTATANCLYRPPVQRVFLGFGARRGSSPGSCPRASPARPPRASPSTRPARTPSGRAASSNAKTFFEGKPGSAARSARSRRPATSVGGGAADATPALASVAPRVASAGAARSRSSSYDIAHEPLEVVDDAHRLHLERRRALLERLRRRFSGRCAHCERNSASRAASPSLDHVAETTRGMAERDEGDDTRRGAGGAG